jgi:DNA-binding transcriptional LysR family regulator
VPIRGPHHNDVDSDIFEPIDAVHPRALDRHLAFARHAERGKKAIAAARSSTTTLTWSNLLIVMSTDPEINIRLAREGVGLTISREDRMRDDIARGTLVPVLEEFSPPFAGYYLYYPTRQQVSPALRALIEHLRGSRGQTRSTSRQQTR